MKHGRVTELPEDFWIPIPLDTDNITSLSPFLVPQDHLASSGTYYAMAIYMLFIFIVGSFINALTIACTMQNKKLRSHLNYILVNLAISNLLVSGVGSFTAFCTFACRYFILGPLACKIEGFIVTLGVYNPVIYVLLNKQFRSCMMKMLGMGGADDEESSTSSVTEVSKVGPAWTEH